MCHYKQLSNILIIQITCNEGITSCNRNLILYILIFGLDIYLHNHVPPLNKSTTWTQFFVFYKDFLRLILTNFINHYSFKKSFLKIYLQI